MSLPPSTSFQLGSNRYYTLNSPAALLPRSGRPGGHHRCIDGPAQASSRGVGGLRKLFVSGGVWCFNTPAGRVGSRSITPGGSEILGGRPLKIIDLTLDLMPPEEVGLAVQELTEAEAGSS